MYKVVCGTFTSTFAETRLGRCDNFLSFQVPHESVIDHAFHDLANTAGNSTMMVICRVCCVFSWFWYMHHIWLASARREFFSNPYMSFKIFKSVLRVYEGRYFRVRRTYVCVNWFITFCRVSMYPMACMHFIFYVTSKCASPLILLRVTSSSSSLWSSRLSFTTVVLTSAVVWSNDLVGFVSY